MGALDLEVDGTRLPVQLTASSFPAVEAMRRGEGTIRLQLAAMLPPLSVGSHHLLFRNRHLWIAACTWRTRWCPRAIRWRSRHSGATAIRAS